MLSTAVTVYVGKVCSLVMIQFPCGMYATIKYNKKSQEDHENELRTVQNKYPKFVVDLLARLGIKTYFAGPDDLQEFA